MQSTLCLRLPFLRGPLPPELERNNLGPDSGDAPLWPLALRLWPGLPVDDAFPATDWYFPEGYPFGPREAAACMNDLRHMDAAALSGLPLGAAVAGNARAARQMTEMAVLEGWDGRAGADDAQAIEAARWLRLEREQAQKALLWLWLQEERLAELAGLTRRYAENAGRLTASLGVDADEAPQGLPFLGSAIMPDPSLIPPWRLAAANAVYFLPSDAVLVAEGPMREDLLERLDFSPAPHYAEALGCKAGAAGDIVEARAPLWQALGRTHPASNGPAAGQYNAGRVWLTWRQV